MKKLYAIIIVSALTISVNAASDVWGGAISGNWNNLANWNGATVPITGTNILFMASGLGGAILTNAITAGTSFNSVTFSNAASAYTVNGNIFAITGGMTNNSSNVQSITNSITLGANATFFDNSAGVNYYGIISGAFSLTNAGSGTNALFGLNTYSGNTVVNAGTLLLAYNIGSGGGNAPGAGTGSITVNNGATAKGNTHFTVWGGNSNTRSISILGGTVDLQGFNDYWYSATLMGGSLIGVGSLGRVAFNGGTITTLATNVSSTISAPIDMTYSNIVAAVALGTVAGGVDLLMSGVISENNGAGSGAKTITKNGAGLMSISGNNSFTGGVLVNAGVLLLSYNIGFSAGTAPAAGTGAITVYDGATARGGDHFTIWGGGGGGTGGSTRTVTVLGGTVDLQSFTEYWYGLTMMGGSMIGSSSLARTAPTGGNITTLATNIVSTISAPIDMTWSNLTITVAKGTVPSGIDLLMSGNISENNGAGSGAKSLTKLGAGTLTLSNINNYSGSTIINAGSLVLSPSATLSNSSSFNIAAGATFDVSSNATYTLTSSNSIVTSGTGTSSGSNASEIKAGTTISFGSRPVTFNFTPTSFSGDTTHPSLLVSSGALTITNSVITITNLSATSLGVGTYRIVQVTGGTITVLSSSTLSISSLASGLTSYLSVSGGNLNLIVESKQTWLYSFIEKIKKSLSNREVNFYHLSSI